MPDTPAEPSLNHLKLFEVTARHGSFTRAADELGISQPAVSHAIRQLESELGVSLFERRHKGVSPTAAGQYLQEEVSAGLTRIDRALREVRAMRGPRQVSLAVSTATATWWLLPRIARFKVLHPQIELRCITTDTDLDLDREHIDLAITLGAGPFSQYQHWPFVDEEIFPVCSPAFLDRHGRPDNAAALARLPLLHLEERYKPRMHWSQWFGHFDVTLPPGNMLFRFNDYSIVLQAAIEGQGVAQGWRHIVAPLMAQGQLVRPLEKSVRTTQPFFVVAPAGKVLHPDVLALKDWLVAEAGDGKDDRPVAT